MPTPAADDGRDDGELARLAAAGDRSAAEALVGRHQAAVRGFLRRLVGRDDLADDLAQETFLRLLTHAGRYDAAYPMKTWLLTIARRLSINHGRKAERRVGPELHLADVASLGDGPDDAAMKREATETARRQLDEALAQLTEPQRAAVVLFHQQGLGIEAVAKAMELPVGTVKSHLHRGRAAMRKTLTPHFQEVQP